MTGEVAVAADNLTVLGDGQHSTIFDFTDQDVGSNGFSVTSDGVTFWNLLLQTNAELAESGLPPESISHLRRSITGHTRPLSKKWASTIGMWGRISAAADIAEEVGVSPSQVKTYKNKWGLRTATKQLSRWPWEVAAGVFFERYLSGDECRRRWGV